MSNLNPLEHIANILREGRQELADDNKIAEVKAIATKQEIAIEYVNKASNEDLQTLLVAIIDKVNEDGGEICYLDDALSQLRSEQRAEDDEVLCGACNGSGEGQYDGTICHFCRGTGTERYEE